jgi:dienelactone hydrolase
MSAVSWSRADGSAVPGLAYGDAGKPGVICIQEWWGVEFDVKEHVSGGGAAGGWATVAAAEQCV